MDGRGVIFLQVMAGIAIVGVLSFLIFLISRQAIRASGAGRSGYQPQWYELLLAAVVAAAALIVVLWQFLPGGEGAWDEGGRALTFFVIMLIVAGGALIVFLLTVFVRISRAKVEEAPRVRAKAEPVTAPLAKQETPSAGRLIGLLAFAVGFLVLNWAHVPTAQQMQLMTTLIYPAGLVVALVFLFDKASRAWDIKRAGEPAREWVWVNLLLFLYVLGYLNLLDAAGAEEYGGLFWDMIHVVGLLLMIWVLDRLSDST